MARCLQASLLVLVIALTFAGLANTAAAEWRAVPQTRSVFVGDWINITVSGDTAPPAPFLHATLKDSNASVVDDRFLLVVNGSGRFAYKLNLSAMAGGYEFIVSVNSSVIARTSIEVIFDENNYNSKRLAILEAQVETQRRLIAAQALRLQEAEDKVEWYWMNIVVSTIVLLALFLIVWLFVLPYAVLLYEWHYPVGRRHKWGQRIAAQLVSRYGRSDLRAYHPHLRTLELPIETDPLYRQQRRLKGLPMEHIPRSRRLEPEPDLPKVKPIRRGDRR